MTRPLVELLYYLAQNAGMYIDHHAIPISGMESPETVNVCIHRIRRYAPEVRILTKRGAGYMLVPDKGA